MKPKKSIDFTALLFLLPLMIILCFVYFYPLLSMVNFSVRNVSLTKTTGDYVGISNYLRLADFIWPVVKRTLIWTFGSVLPALVIGLVVALLSQGEFFGKKLFTTAILIPYCMPLTIAAYMWMSLYHTSFGLFNTLLLKLGLSGQPISFLSYHNALSSVIIIRIWRAFPFAFLNYYAGLQSIPTEYLEAARIDGASSWQCFFHITLPLLRSVTMVTLIILTVWTALVFDIIFPLTGGGPLDATEIIPIKLYKISFHELDVGLASALSIVTVFVLIPISWLYWRLTQRGGEV